MEDFFDIYDRDLNEFEDDDEMNEAERRKLKYK